MSTVRRGAVRVLALVAIAGWSFAIAFAIGSAGTARAAGAGAADAGADLPGPRLEQRRTEPQTTVDDVSRTVMCPSCDTTLDQSNSDAAERMRVYVTEAVAAGWTEGEIRDGLVAEYGGDEAVLATPSTHGIGLVAWIVPVVLALLALLSGAVVVRRWRRDAATAGAQGRPGSSSYAQSAESSSSAGSDPSQSPS